MSDAAVLAFGPFVLDLPNARLTREGRVVELAPKAFELLACLARRAGELVVKDDLLDTVWGRRFISEGVVKTAMSELRAALDDDARSPRWIETVPRRGYRFIGAVRAAGEEASIALPAAPASHGPGRLPRPATALLGRAAECAQLLDLLAVQRLVTIVGPAGIGKTRLAIDVAWEATRRLHLPEGAWFVELAALAPDSHGGAALRGLLVQRLGLPDAVSANETALLQALQGQQLLLVLDNAEHLLDLLAPLVTTLLAQAPGVRLLISSQEPLRLDGEQLLRLAPLTVPAPADDEDEQRLLACGAVRLFIERIAARLPGFALTPHHRAAVAAICRSLDGLPLALELAAARVPLLGVHGLAERLDGGDDDARLRLLTHGPRGAEARQRTLSDALAWSHALLAEPQQRVLRRLAVFRGGFTLPAAQAVCRDETLDAWAVLDALDALVEKSLLIVSESGRFSLLESVRAFALEQLQRAGELEAWRDRQLAQQQAYWNAADDLGFVSAAQPWLAQHAPELDNLRAALQWAQADADRADAALQLVAASALLLFRLGLSLEWRRWHDAVQAQAAVTSNAGALARFDLALAFMAMNGHVFGPQQGLAAAERAAERSGPDAPAADAARHFMALYIGYFLLLRVRPQDDRDAVIAALAAALPAEANGMLQGRLHGVRAYELRGAGQVQDYLAMCREQLALYQHLGAQTEAWNAAWGLMLAEHDNGRPAQALAVGRAALAEIGAAGRLAQHLPFQSLWLIMLAESGDAGARTALVDTLPLMRRAGTPWMSNLAFAWLAAHEGRSGDAALLLAWHDAELAARGEVNSGWLLRSTQDLAQCLRGRLGDGYEARRIEGATLGQAAALELGLTEP